MFLKQNGILAADTTRLPLALVPPMVVFTFQFSKFKEERLFTEEQKEKELRTGQIKRKKRRAIKKAKRLTRGKYNGQ